MKVILTVGLPASGKTTWAKQHVRDNPGTIRFNNDEFSYMTTGWDDGRSFEPMDPVYLKFMRQQAVKLAAMLGADIVLDNTNLSRYAHDEAQRLAPLGTLETVFFKADVDTCIQRNTARGCPIPNSVITDMAAKYADDWDWL